MNPLLHRACGLLALAGAGLLAPTESAEAYSRAIHTSEINVAHPQYLHETSSQFRVEGKDNAGNLVGISRCPALGYNCPSSIAGAVTNVVVLEIDLDREEVLSEKCKGIVSTVPQLRCENGDLEVTLRVRMGELVVKVSTEGNNGPLLDTTTSGGKATRFEFLGSPTNYWETNPYWNDSKINAYHFPAGKYKVYAPDLGRHCKPVQTNPGVDFDLPAGGRTTVEIIYRGTECTVQIATDVDISGLTMASDSGALTCEAKGQVGVASTKTICTGVFPFNQPVRLSATVPAGLQPYFARVGAGCDYSPVDRTTCSFTPTLDRRADNFTNIHMTAQAAAAPPPPPPVALSVAAGASAPDDRPAMKGAVGETMLQLRATAANGTAMMSSLTLQASGSGRDDMDLVEVRVVLDANGNGIADPGETVVGRGRPAADNGVLRIDFASPVAVSSATDLVVVADIAAVVNSASAAAWGGAGVFLALGVMAWPAGRRRLVPGLLAIAVVLVITAGCGGSDDDAVDPPVVVDPPVNPVPPAPPVLLSYRLDATAAEAVDTSTPANVVNVAALPVIGATVTVEK
ncbi:MAG: hypothetical protein ABI460_03540 [Caldimonas sp.]